ncbi:MAG: hypothetical protein AAFU60_10585 [Bacteroidota bacterium]
MFQNWLKPIPSKTLQSIPVHLGSLGANIPIFQARTFPKMEGCQVAIIGIDSREADAIRGALYGLENTFGSLSIADIGNTRKKNPAFLIPLLGELFDSKIFPILIGKDPKHFETLFQAALQYRSSLSVGVIDDRLALSGHKRPWTNYLDPLFTPKKADLFHLSLLGGQAHFLDQKALKKTKPGRVDFMRLGELKTELREAEPLLRDADVLFAHPRAIKSSDAPGVAEMSPSGLFSEEICQLMRYAGMSDKLMAMGIFGYEYPLDQRNQTAGVIAQMLWYFLQGLDQRKGDFPVSTDGLVEYVVDAKDAGFQWTFWKSNKTGRWWIQVPVPTNEKEQRHRLVPCSFADYQETSKGELPDRLVQAFRRFA